MLRVVGHGELRLAWLEEIGRIPDMLKARLSGDRIHSTQGWLLRLLQVDNAVTPLLLRSMKAHQHGILAHRTYKMVGSIGKGIELRRYLGLVRIRNIEHDKALSIVLRDVEILLYSFLMEVHGVA